MVVVVVVVGLRVVNHSQFGSVQYVERLPAAAGSHSSRGGKRIDPTHSNQRHHYTRAEHQIIAVPRTQKGNKNKVRADRKSINGTRACVCVCLCAAHVV